jgi:hypothetical protein
MTNNIEIKIEKLFEYFDRYERNKISFYFLRDTTRDCNSYSFNKIKQAITCHSWDESGHNGDSYNESDKDYPISEVGEKVYVALLEQAMEKAEKDYDSIQEKLERENKLKNVKNYLNSQIYDQSVAFILED